MNPAPPVTKSIPIAGTIYPSNVGIGANLCLYKPSNSS